MTLRRSLRNLSVVFAAVLGLVVVAGCGEDGFHPLEAEAPSATVNAGWVAAAPEGSTTTAYFTLFNNAGGRTITLKSVTMDEASSSKLVGDASAFKLTPKKLLEMAPGGPHVEFVLNKTLSAGDEVSMTLHFSDHSKTTIDGIVRNFDGTRLDENN